MAIVPELLRGHIDTMILARLEHKESYGYEISKNIMRISKGQYELKEAALYTAFRRLEEMGFLNSYWGDETTGARRRYYLVTPSGKHCLEESRKNWKDTKILIDRLLEEDASHE